MSDSLEDFWAEILSAEPNRVHPAWARLSSDERGIVEAHLKRMASDPGWSAGQRRRARAALDCLGFGPSLDI